MYIHQHNQPASKNARQLSEQLIEVVRAAKQSNKSLSYVDVYQATRLTSHRLRVEFGGTSARLQLWIALGVLVVVMLTAVVVATLYL